MADNDQTNTTTPTTTPAPSADIVVKPDAPAPKSADDTDDPKAPRPPASTQQPQDDSEIISDVASRIADAHNILIALSADPSVDEMAAAIGLSIALDRAGKRATAIYSGQTPNALEFLKPEKTFEATADTLQDFVIAINKEKADHLRYKLDGDYVKIFITPYKARVAEEDLEFSYGDFNIDLVLALDVANGVDLDSALREHGRIMHDATVVNITTGNPGKFGEIEWSNKSSSSVSEMVARLLISMNRKLTIEADDATALLTGIVAATNHFSNTQTTPSAMRVASDLLRLGANQQLISQHITDSVDNNYVSTPTTTLAKMDDSDSADSHQSAGDATSLDISHDDESEQADSTTSDEKATESPASTESLETPTLTPANESDGSEGLIKIDNTPAPAEPIEAPVATPAPIVAPAEEGTTEPAKPLLDTPTDLANFTDSPATDATANATPAPAPVAPIADVPAAPAPIIAPEPTAPVAEPSAPVMPTTAAPVAPAEPLATPSLEPPLSGPSTDFLTDSGPEKVVAPSTDFNLEPSPSSESRTYSQMLEDALAENPAASVAPIVSPMPAPEVNNIPDMNYATPAPAPIVSPATPMATTPVAAPAAPVINGTPEMNYNMPGDILPPPPVPNVSGDLPPMPDMMPTADFGMPASPTPMVVSPSSVIVDPSQPATSATPVSSGAFQIPGI